jgi:DegV family protein with EDD domain
MSIRVVTDSNCDLPPEAVAEHRLSIVPLFINVGNESYFDGVTMSRAEFYEGLPDFKSHPTTSVPGIGSFLETYNRLADEGATEILSIHIAGSLSAVADVARLAAQEFKRAPVTVVDSGQLTLGTGLLALAAAKAAAAGQSMTGIVRLLEDQASRTYCFAALDTLEFLRRSGRLTRLQSRLGALLRVKPLLKMHRGSFDMERVRTRNGAQFRLLQLIGELGPLEELALVHTHAPDRAQALGQQARHLMPKDRVPLLAEVTPVIGAHIGPGAVGFVAIKAREEEGGTK